MNLPKQRLTVDLDHKLLAWLMEKAVRENISRNEAIARCIEGVMESSGSVQASETSLGVSRSK